jgi:hypothetical protein
MKTAKNYLLIVLSIISITAIIYSCEEIKDTIDEYNSDDSCPERIFADTVSGQYIIKFKKFDNFDRQKPYIDRIRDSIKADSYEIETCDCDPFLVLVTFKSSTGIDMEKLRGRIRSELEDEGNGTYNYIFEHKVESDSYTNTYFNKPGDYSRRTVVLAVIDGGIASDKVEVKPNPHISYDFTGESKSNPSVTINSHGTIVSQIATEKINPDSIQ